jgi:Mrp family chromosome partitioning ATPase
MSKNFELIKEAELNLHIATAEPRVFTVTSSKVETHSRATAANPDNLARVEALKLVQSVFLMQRETPVRTVVFAGVDAGSGCSQICARAAEVLTNDVNGSVCLVDANLRSPSLPQLLNTSNHHGLTDALLTNDPVGSYTKRIGPGNLWLLSGGSQAASHSGALNSERMKARVAELRREYDFILVDAPPLNSYADAIALGQLADGLVLILEADITRRESAVRVTENLRSAHINVLGAVLNRRSFPIPEALYRML